MKKYNIKITVAEFLKYQTIFETNRVEQEEGYLRIKINHTVYQKLTTLEVKFEIDKNYQKEFFSFISLKRGFIIGLFLMVSFLLVNNFRVNEIIFNNQFLINDQIQKKIDENSVKIFNQRFISTQVLKKLNQEILEDYVSYEYISLKRDGTTIQVTINKEELKSYQKEHAQIGDLVAKKNGVVKFFNIYDGKSLVYLNKMVKKDELLVSSNMLYGLELKQEELVSARGFVICEVIDYVDMILDQEQLETVYTNRVEEKKCIDVLNKSTCNVKTSFHEYDSEKTTVFNFFNIFKVNQVKLKEKTTQKIILTKEQVIDLGKEMILEQFDFNKKIDYEKVLAMEAISAIQRENKIEIRYLVTKMENIAKFRLNN